MSMGKNESFKAEVAVYNDPPIPQGQVIQRFGWNQNWAFSQALDHCINNPPPQIMGEYYQQQQPQIMYRGNNNNIINNNNANNGSMCSFMFCEEDPQQYRNNASHIEVSEKLRLSLQAIHKQTSRSYSQELPVRKQIKRESPMKNNQPIRNGQDDKQLVFTGAKKHSGEVSFNSYNEELRNVKYTSVSYFCQNKRENDRKEQQQNSKVNENKNGEKYNNIDGSQEDKNNKKNEGFLDNNSESSAMWGFRRLEEDRKYDWEVEDIIAQTSWRGGTVQSRVLGKGAFGNVIKATDNNTTEQYALKFLKRSFYSKAITETAIMKQFHDNAHIIQYHDVYLYDQQTESNQIIEVQQYLVIVMELAQASLEDILQLRMSCQAHWTGTELLSIFKHIASAVKSLAGKHISHRDIKPSNILYCLNTKHYKLADFGEAKMVKTVDFEGSHSPRGTKKYMSPELLQGLQELQISKQTKNENGQEDNKNQEKLQQQQPVAEIKVKSGIAENIREEIPYGDVKYEPYANDIYSLGVCFFQLKFLDDLSQYKGRESKTVETEMYFQSRFHEEEDRIDKLISRMLDLNPRARPNINEVVTEIDQLIQDKTLETEEDKIVVYAFKTSKEQQQQQQQQEGLQNKKNESQTGNSSTQGLQVMNQRQQNNINVSQTMGNLRDEEKDDFLRGSQGNLEGQLKERESQPDSGEQQQQQQNVNSVQIIQDQKQSIEYQQEYCQQDCQSLELNKIDVINCDDVLSWSKNMNVKITVASTSQKKDQDKQTNSDRDRTQHCEEEEESQNNNSDDEEDEDDDDDDMDSENEDDSQKINIISQNNPTEGDQQQLIGYSNQPALSTTSSSLISQVDESQFLKLMETKRASNLTVEQQVQHYIARAQAYENLLKFQKARDTFYELYQTHFSSLSAREQVRLLKNLGRLDHKMSKFDLAIRFYQQLLCILKSSNELQDKEVSDVYSMLGSACCCQGDYEAALRYYGESLAKKEQLKLTNCIDGDDAETADLLVYIGLVKKHLGEYASSLEYYERALAVVTKQSPLNTDLLRISAIKKHMGSIYDRLNNNHKSIACLEAALHDMITANGYESERVVNCLNKLGIVLVHSGKHNHEAAIAHFENAMKIMKKLYKMDTISEATRKLFRFQDKPQDPNILPLYTRAFSVNEEAYILYRQVYDYYHLGVAVILEIRGMIYHFLNEFEYCLKYYSEALNIYSRILKPEHEFVKRSSAFVELAKNQQQFQNFPSYQVE